LADQARRDRKRRRGICQLIYFGGKPKRVNWGGAESLDFVGVPKRIEAAATKLCATRTDIDD